MSVKSLLFSLFATERKGAMMPGEKQILYVQSFFPFFWCCVFVFDISDGGRNEGNDQAASSSL